MAECPFPSDEVKNLKAEVVQCAATSGYDLRREAADRINTPIDFRFLQLLLTVAGDPEVHLGDLSLGVRVGPGARLPRLPALYPAKKRWRLSEQGDPRNYLEQVDTVSMWRTNYASLDVFPDKVLAVLEDQATRGQVIKMTEHEARRRYPDLVVASLGAQRKDKPGGAVSARVLFDGTHGITVNTRTRIRDQERGPIAADLKRVMREKSRVGVPTFALTADVSEAHRQISQSQNGTGISSGVKWFLVVQSSLTQWVRLALRQHPTTGHVLLRPSVVSLSTWQAARLTRGTCWWLTTTILMRAAQTTEQHCFTFSPSAQQRTTSVMEQDCRGDVVSWVGFELLHRTRMLGITQRRADWLTKWSREVAAALVVNMASFEEGLGRVMYVVSALEYERPFLAPLYRFMTMHPRRSTRRVPAYVRFILNYIAEEVSGTRHYPRDSVLWNQTCSPEWMHRQVTTVREWEKGYLTLTDQGRADPRKSAWFSLEVSPEDFPWVFVRGKKPSQVISTLEALAVLLSLKLFAAQQPEGQRCRVTILPTWTDNRGNGSVLNQLMTTRYPSSALVMELAAEMKKNRVEVQVEWTPREFNREADALANGDTSQFSPELELRVEPHTLKWHVLDRAVEMGLIAEKAHDRLRRSGGLPDRARKQKRRKPEERLKFKDPW